MISPTGARLNGFGILVRSKAHCSVGYAGGLRGEWEMFRMKMLAVTGTWQIKRLSHSLTVVLNPGQDCPPPGGKKCGDI